MAVGSAHRVFAALFDKQRKVREVRASEVHVEVTRRVGMVSGISARCPRLSLVSGTTFIALMVPMVAAVIGAVGGSPRALDSRLHDNPLRGCLRLRGGISSRRGKKFSISSMPRAKSMRQIAPAWSEQYGGKTLEINGTRYYHYEYRVDKREVVEVAVRKLKAQLRKYGGTEELIGKCGDDPRKLERYLDEALFVLDCWKRRGRLPAWVADGGTPEIKKDKEKAKQDLATSKERRKAKLHGSVESLLRGRASAWFDDKLEQDDDTGAASAAASAAAVVTTKAGKCKKRSSEARRRSGVAGKRDARGASSRPSSAARKRLRSEQGTKHTANSSTGQPLSERAAKP